MTQGKRPNIGLLPSRGALDVDLAAKATVPFMLELLQLDLKKRPALRLVDKDPHADAALLRSLSPIVEGS